MITDGGAEEIHADFDAYIEVQNTAPLEDNVGGIHALNLTDASTMNYIRIEMGEKTLVGKSEDIIIGTVSEDGSVWNATLNSFPEYGGFPVNPDELPYTQEVTFLKTAKDF